MSVKDNSPTPLSVMVGSGEIFEVQGKKYTVMPMSAAHVEEFMKDNIPLNGFLFALSNEDTKKILNKWLGEVLVELSDGTEVITRYCKNTDGETMTIEKAFADGWSIKDFKRYIHQLCDISG